MNKEKIENLISRAGDLEIAVDLPGALKQYSDVLDILVADAKNYAQAAGGGEIVAVSGTGSISERYLVKFNEYLKKDKIAATVSNYMGLLFARMENKESARVFFEQAIDLTPAGVIYDAPHVGLEMLKKL